MFTKLGELIFGSVLIQQFTLGRLLSSELQDIWKRTSHILEMKKGTQTMKMSDLKLHEELVSHTSLIIFELCQVWDLIFFSSSSAHCQHFNPTFEVWRNGLFDNQPVNYCGEWGFSRESNDQASGPGD